MEKHKKHGKLYELWRYFSMKQKLCVFAGTVVLSIILAILSNILTIDYALYGFGTIMDDNVKSYTFLEAVVSETKAFEAYVRSRTEENQLIYETASLAAEQSVWELPYDYERIGATRYARTWSIRNFYMKYVEERDRLLTMNEKKETYVPYLYKVYKMQEYMDLYARRLMQLTMQEGNNAYLAKVVVLHRVPYILFSVAFVVVGVIVFLTFLMWHAMVTPVEQLAHLSRKIARKEFPKEDLIIENQDEMGELVKTFNKMKHATIGYIEALEGKYEIAQVLYKEELERVELEKNLEATRLEVLKSQINPHFLFNTLNMIACMAKLEEADVTNKMITSMSNLFRYNLKNTETEVPLRQELKIVDDYMYLQQMRFGSRIQYNKDVEQVGMNVIIPSFSLQPLVENAILHGLSKKEQGGKLFVRAWIREKILTVSVMDTGVGIDNESLKDLQEAMSMWKTSRIGIGLGNIYKRLHMMYEGADLQIYSKKDIGTVVQMKIPQKQ